MKKYLFIYLSGGKALNKIIVAAELSQNLIENFRDTNKGSDKERATILNIIELNN